MRKAGSSIRNEGDNNTNINGDRINVDQRNITNVVFENRFLSRTLLFEFCDKFSRIDVPIDYGDLLEPSKYEEKMDYNSIEVYKSIFLEVDHYYDDIEDILMAIVRRERILSNINNTYRKHKRFSVWTDKDHLCEMVYKDLIQQTLNDASFSEMYIEDTQEAIHALMYYAFTKCRLLDPVPVKSTQN
ncbi:hypothetical protein M3591_09575 [Exiguobacterium sp. MER 193]|uniref:hypothetical protein n=1 Tax=Exiguobacterium sp. MER 193 TaxID=2939564 RepID=UPI0020425FB5|nr:hypothetical protein [Exiguobacterium sp. MER 193]MCM3280782.1 hypothetical protein [Exiguobacterium sp. MER 193]